ncbi:MAG TPA: serine hydrolase domain-containing protein [Terriglobales bacterium]|nr:serine hydrolase domain-containing protein [Terriglobales bacterium]
MILRSCFCVSFILFLGFLAPLHAADKVDEYMQAVMKERQIPGIALLVVQDGKVVRSQGYGFSNVELQVPVKPETIFQSGSVGKQFTATGVMMLVEEGKVGLEDLLTKYFPDAPDTWKAVTVRNLLSHTGGFTDYPETFDFRKDYSEDDILKIIEGIPLAYPPGTKWAYSNLGYATLGILIHKVSGKFYGDFLQERIFGPLGMSTTRIINEADIIPNRSSGYRLVKGALKNQEWVSPSLNTTADGSLYFSIVDLQKWDAALAAGKLLKKSSYDQMWTIAKLKDGTPNSGNYGFAWFLNTVHGHRIIEHEGAWQGFNTSVNRYVDDKLTVIVLANLAACEPGDIAHHVAGLYVPELTPDPNKKDKKDSGD